MGERLDHLLVAINVSFPLARDRARAEAILEAALCALMEARQQQPLRKAPTDAIGAPLYPRQRARDADWPALRTAAKEIIAAIGIERAASEYGASPATLRDVVYRAGREPGPGRKARLYRLIAGENTGSNVVAMRE